MTVQMSADHLSHVLFFFNTGLLGGQYVGISPGGSDAVYKDGDKIEFVQDAIVLEHLISKYLFKQADKAAAGANTATPPPAKE